MILTTYPNRNRCNGSRGIPATPAWPVDPVARRTCTRTRSERQNTLLYCFAAVLLAARCRSRLLRMRRGRRWQNTTAKW